jgi:hypothetical protein
VIGVEIEELLREQTRVLKEVVSGQLLIVQLLERMANPPMLHSGEESREFIARTVARFCDPKLTPVVERSPGGVPRHRLDPETLTPWRMVGSPATNKPSELVTIVSRGGGALRTIEQVAWESWAYEHHCARSSWITRSGRPAYCSECGTNYPDTGS